MEKMKLVMIGNGMAGARTLEELLKLAPGLYEITVFGAESYANYNRILLSQVLSGEQTIRSIMLNDVDWYAEKGITLHLNKPVAKINRAHRTVQTADGEITGYDRLIIATGSTPIILPVPGNDLEGVISFRSIHDVDAMIEASAKFGHAVVIGGGLLGLEAAYGLLSRGMDVTVVHLAEWLMERQLDQAAGRMLQKSLEAKGIKFLLQKQTECILGEGRARAIRFTDGTEIPAELVVMAAGIRPNAALAEAAGIHCNRGIVVNDTMQTYDPRIYAVGECASHRGVSYGLVAPLFEMAKVCANHLAELGIGRYTGSAISTKLKVTGIDLFSAGDFNGGEHAEEIVMHDTASGIYKKLVIKDNKLVGSILYGNTVDGAWYFQLLREGRDIADIRDSLLLGQNHLGNTGHQGENRAAAMPDSMEVCGCNGVTKGCIVKAIKEKGLFTLNDVRKHTKASASCGSCTGLVEQILASTLGGAYTPTPVEKPVCACTDHTHAEVRMAIRKHKLLTIPEVISFMEWSTPDGCASCRPALNYYLISTWPHEAKDDPRSRHINERVHANIQKLGDYSVVPRMWGGVTTPEQLRRIADVADKHQIPAIKVTGGQRIALAGIKKEDLPKVWGDLGMPSGYAYGKSLRSVKTCVGNAFCRFGTQNTLGMGIDLEKAFWGMWAPHKVKLGISGCPRNCSEAAIKDIGVIGVESGWEIYVAGNGGTKTEVAQFFAKVKTQEEVMEHAAAFLELYRQEGYYMERTAQWTQRVGLDYAKKRVVEDESNRKTLHQQLMQALEARKDPWEEFAVKGVEQQEFKVLEILDEVPL